MTAMRVPSMASAIRAGIVAWAGNLRRRLAVMRRWPSLAFEVLAAGFLIWLVFGHGWLVSFCVWITGLGGTSVTSGPRMRIRWRQPHIAHSNLFIQKLAPASLVLGYLLVGANPDAALLNLGWAAVVPGLVASWIWSWWSPEIDSRWRIAGSDDEPDKYLKDEEYDSQ